MICAPIRAWLPALVFVGLAACVPPLPGGSLDTGAGGAAGATSAGAAGMVGPGGSGGRPAPSSRGGAPGAGAVGGSAVGAGGSGGVPGPTGPAPNLGGWPGPGETTGSAGASGADGGTAPTCIAPRCTPRPGCLSAPPVTSSVSGFENTCNDVAPVDGRDGVWFVYATGSTQTDPSPNEPFRVACDGAAGTCYANCIRGSLAGSGYPTAGIAFTPVKDLKAYDASRYRGVAFFLYVGGVSPSASFRLQVPLVADQDPAYGGSCTTGCFNTYMLPLPLNPSGWMRYEVDFAQLAQQPGWGTPEA
jgi:hypothetical protein